MKTVHLQANQPRTSTTPHKLFSMNEGHTRRDEMRSLENIIPNVIVVVLRSITSKASFAICFPHSQMPTTIWLCNELKCYNTTTWVLSERLQVNSWSPSITTLTLISLIIVSPLNSRTNRFTHSSMTHDLLWHYICLNCFLVRLYCWPLYSVNNLFSLYLGLIF